MDVKLMSQILAVVVLYKKSYKESITLSKLSPLLKSGLQLLVYDNSPQPDNTVPADFIYYHDASNSGVSGAYNYAAELGLKYKKKYLWLLDDDTAVDPDFLTEFEELIENQSFSALLAPQVYSGGMLLSPFSFKNSTPKRLATIRSGEFSLEQYRPINSGILIELDLLKKAGGFNPSLPLDFSDIEFTDRLSKILSTFNVSTVKFQHGFSGDETTTRDKAFTRFDLYLSAARKYYELAANPIAIKVQVLRHALKLSLKYRSFKFVSHYLKARF